MVFYKHLEWDKWVFDKVFNLQKKFEVIHLLDPLKFDFKSILLFNFGFRYDVCMCMSTCVHATVQVRRSEDSLGCHVRYI